MENRDWQNLNDRLVAIAAVTTLLFGSLFYFFATAFFDWSAVSENQRMTEEYLKDL